MKKLVNKYKEQKQERQSKREKNQKDLKSNQVDKQVRYKWLINQVLKIAPKFRNIKSEN